MQAEKKEVISQWTGSAPYWEKHREIIRGMFAPVAQALIADARIKSNGMSIRRRRARLRRMRSALPSAATYWAFSQKLARPRHPSASCGSRYAPRFPLNSFGHCGPKCQTNFAPTLPCFQASGGPNSEARLSKPFAHSQSMAA
jgi:hypothetical protein